MYYFETSKSHLGPNSDAMNPVKNKRMVFRWKGWDTNINMVIISKELE